MVENICTYYSDIILNANKSMSDFYQNITKAESHSPVLSSLQELYVSDLNFALGFLFQNPEQIAAKMENWMVRQSEIVSHFPPNDEEKRFEAPEWNNSDHYSLIKNSYLILSRTIENMVSLLHCPDDNINLRMDFFTRQILNALSPANFVFSNPEISSLTAETNGENLVSGVNNLFSDVGNSNDILNVRQADQHAFSLGKDIATTSGGVVYKNDLCEVIQYHPVTQNVNKTPLLIIPPIINKFYILDLNTRNSMVKWLLEQGHSVFILSWRNPDISLGNVGFEHYVLNGVVKAVNVIENITGYDRINAAGYCLGGTLLAATLAYYAAKKMKRRIKTASFFTTILDFSTPGDIGAYLHPQVINAIDEQNIQQGYMDGRMLNVTFNLLRENSLYWNFYVDRYLKGMKPEGFDLLYWSSDSTNITASCWRDVVKSFYMNNELINPRGFKVGGVYLDLTKIDVPCYFVSTLEDHIALWQGTYKGARNLKGPVTFVLGKSGHVAGIINPPSRNKYGYWVNTNLPEVAEEWLSEAELFPGSWWKHWDSWLTHYEAAEPVPAYPMGNAMFPVTKPAPGEYVLSRLA